MTPRQTVHHYADPLDRVWTTAALRIGLVVKRTADAYASTTGRGEMLLATAPHLDPDDSLAQMVFHEFCHSLIQGAASFTERDWGLDNETDRDSSREQACLRLQAALADRHGLRHFLAPTTDYRAFYDDLGADPLGPRHDPTVALAILGLARSQKTPWAPHLDAALAATEVICRQAAEFAEKSTKDGRVDLYSGVGAAPSVHPTGLRGSNVPGRSCGTCGFAFGAPSKCRKADGARVNAEWPGCEGWEAQLDCQTCGACCREAFDCVEVSVRDPARKKHPELIVLQGPRYQVKRNGPRCAALGGGQVEPLPEGGLRQAPYACSIYEDRPRSCRDFERGSKNCLFARKRVGLSV